MLKQARADERIFAAAQAPKKSSLVGAKMAAVAALAYSKAPDFPALA